MKTDNAEDVERMFDTSNYELCIIMSNIIICKS